MRSSSLWSELVKIALMGTDRQSPSPPPGHPNNSDNPFCSKIEHLLTQLDWTEPETAILNAAGAIAFYTQSGYSPTVPASLAPLPPEIPASPLPLCSPQTAKHLRHGLSHDGDFCAEVLAGLMFYQQRIPDEYQPALLDFGVRFPDWQSLIVQVIGERGRWLARQNPEWDYGQWDWALLPTDSEIDTLNDRSMTECEADKKEAGKEGPDDLPEPFFGLWAMGTHSQRVELLQRWRAIAPHAARRLLQTSWKQLSAKDRAALLSRLLIRLQLVDEPFLDQALSDRSATVRSIAAQLLARLPNSQWCQRMTEWGRSLFSIQPMSTVQVTPTSQPTLTNNVPSSGILAPPSLATPLQIQVTLPTFTNDVSTVHPLSLIPSKKAVPNSKSSPKFGRKIGNQPSTTADAIETLIQIVGSMSLVSWDEYGSPAILLQAIQNQQYDFAVIQGWALAAIQQANPQWALALLRHPTIVNDLTRNGPNAEPQGQSIITDLFQILPYCQREEILAEWVPKSTQHQISLLSDPHFANTSYQVAIDQGATDGMTMVKWLQLAVAIRVTPKSANASSSASLVPNVISQIEKRLDSPFTQQWSLTFSQLVLVQLQREVSHQIQPYIRELRTLARAIAFRLDPTLSDSPILAELAERTIPGPSYLDRSWDQSIDIIRSTLALRQAMQATFVQPTAFT